MTDIMSRLGKAATLTLGANLALLLAGCATTTQPANQRGFFGGLGAAVTGADERQAGALEKQAADQEYKARQMANRAAAAEQEARTTSAQVRSAEQRLAAVGADVGRQRERLAALRAGQPASRPTAAEASRLQAEIDGLDRQQRAAAAQASGVSPAVLRTLEDRARALDAALTRLGST